MTGTEAGSFIGPARDDMAEVGALLLRSGLASVAEVADDDGGLVLRVVRKSNGDTVRVTVTGSTEVFLIDINGTYLDAVTAYDEESQREALQDLLACVVAYLHDDYHEEVGKRHGRVVHRVLHLTVPGGTRTMTWKRGVRGIVDRVLGYETEIVRP
jgi:DNA-binding protein YbaB